MIAKEVILDTFWNEIRMNLFVINNRGNMLPNLWGLCSHDHSPTVLHNSSQHINILVSIADKSCYISAVYAHTNYV